MRALLYVLLAAGCVLADDSENRRSKLPYVADAVGNTLPPPSNGPATVGSPVNLLTPDRYEFYTFDESGELVKRLMTLEEIQAIVAAGEETEGLVTFANENQPTIAFNFSQPPYTKVHSVVTNVQNVLKAQMEAHKNRPLTQPTLDTPDVSDSWSLILPSIFGNTGVDIVPDKLSGTFTTPETETIDLDLPVDDNSISKEGNNQIPSTSSTKPNEELKEVSVTEKVTAVSLTTVKQKVKTTAATTTTTTTTTTIAPKVRTTAATTTITTTPKPKSEKPILATAAVKQTTTSAKITTTTAKPITTSTTAKLATTITTAKPATTTTTAKPTTTTLRPTTSNNSSTLKLRTTTTTTNRPLISTTGKPRTTTTLKPTTNIEKNTSKLTTVKLNSSTRKPITTLKEPEQNFTKVETFTNNMSGFDKNTVQYEKVSAFVPLSTAAYVTEKTTEKPVQTTKSFLSTTKRYLPSSSKATSTPAKVQPVITTYKPPTKISTSIVSSTPKEEVEKFNVTTITTQSVSPSTTISSTKFVSNINHQPTEKITKPNVEKPNEIKDAAAEINFFDVAQSFSQIASDLGGDYQPPLPTTSNLLDTTKMNDINIESKENVEIDMPNEGEKSVESKESTSTEVPIETKKTTEIVAIKEHETVQAISGDKNKSNSKLNKPLEEQKIDKPGNPLKIENILEDKKHEINIENYDNFVKISTLEPHENETMVLNKDRNIMTSKTTEPNTVKIELTTSVTMQNTTIDPILTESMDDLFSQVVNQAPQPVVKIEKTNSNKDNNLISTESPKESKLPTNKTFSLVKQNVSDLLEEPILDTKVKTNAIPQIISEVKDDYKKKNTSEKDKTIEKNKMDNQNIFKEIVNKQNFVKMPEITTSKQETHNTQTDKHVPDVTTLKPNKSNNGDKHIQEANKQSSNISESIKKNQVTTLATSKVEFNKSSTILKHESGKVNINKITPLDKNKIANLKENAETSQESQLPVVDEFKKKIQKVNIDDKELINERNNSWKLISTVSPSKNNEISKDKIKSDSQEIADKDVVLDFSKENQGLEVTTKHLGEDIAQFTELCNELAFRYWQTMTESIEKRRSFILSPYSITSMLAMMFMGARGATSGEMNEILKLDDMVTFNPHFTLKNISDSIEATPASGVIVSAFVRELFSDKSKGKILTFYKERAQHFYNGHVEEINFKLISDIIRRRTNLLVKRYTWGRIVEYMKSNTITMLPPLAAFSANIFQTDCSGSSVEGRDGEMYFVVSPNVRQRRLVPVPAVVYRSGFLAGYDPSLDATAAALGNTNSVISTLFLMPGQQGNVVHADDLEALEKRLLDTNPTTPTWNRLLRTLLPRIGLELQIPRFSHKSIFNVSTTLQKMGLKELFDQEHADLGGLNGPSKDLYLSDMVQSTTFVTCGEGVIGEQHHIEEYPESLNGPQRRRTSRWATGWDEPRDYQRAFHDPHDVGEAMNLPLHLRPRQARLPSRNAQPARLKFDRPFLYFVRHNPSGMILYVGRYNPRLLP